ncbi:MAG TPA: tetratricopeptide repeat protein [Polyangiaceae bacterium]|nr:tetratricopeptide repeat protein [Polyangiaceae bacterium]
MRSSTNRTLCLDAARCAEARARKGLSRERLAEESRGGLSLATIKRIENGAAVYLDTARRLATLLDAPLEQLLEANAASTPATDLAEVRRAPAILAVLPFDVMGGDDKDRVFADGLVEDMITRLGRQWFPVIARSSSFAYRGAATPQQVRAGVGADYVIEGSVRRHADMLRITARLVDTGSSEQVWSQAYDRRYVDVFVVEDAIVSTIVSQVSGAVLDQEYRRSMRREPTDLTAWDMALRGSWHFHRRTSEGNVEARSLFEEALRRDAFLPLAWYTLALTYQRAIVNQWTTDPGASLRALHSVCAEFGRHHPNDPGLHVATAYTAIYAGDRPTAKARLKDAIDLDANATVAYSLYGQTLAMENEPDEAIEHFEQAIRLSPQDGDLWSIQTGVALCHFVAERYDEMLRWATRAVQASAGNPFTYGTVAVARVSLGDVDQARTAVQEMLRLAPKTSLQGLQAIVAATHPDIAKRYLERLGEAGVR